MLVRYKLTGPLAHGQNSVSLSLYSSSYLSPSPFPQIPNFLCHFSIYIFSFSLSFTLSSSPFYSSTPPYKTPFHILFFILVSPLPNPSIPIFISLTTSYISPSFPLILLISSFLLLAIKISSSCSIHCLLSLSPSILTVVYIKGENYLSNSLH